MHEAQLEHKLLLLSLDWPSSLNPFKRAQLSAREREWFASFSCLRARCYKPSDRALLLEKIRDKWGDEARFDRFVRTRLLAVMERSKAKYHYQRQLGATAVRSFELTFGD